MQGVFQILEPEERKNNKKELQHLQSPVVNPRWTHGCPAKRTDVITVGRFKVLSKANLLFFFLPCLSRDKIDASQPTASSPAAACPCSYREVNKLKTKQSDKLQQRAVGTEQGRTGLSLRRISPSVPFHQKEGKGRKRGPWFQPSLGNWGSYVWNVSPYACAIPPWQSSGHRSHNLSLFPMRQ